jgi:hypothetical protein
LIQIKFCATHKIYHASHNTSGAQARRTHAGPSGSTSEYTHRLGAGEGARRISLGVTMARTPEIGLLIADCWQQLFLLHKSLAELKRTNAYSWDLLEQGNRFRRIPSVINSQRIDPEVWRKRADEARALADIITNAEAKRSLAEIADTYEALASSHPK